MTAPGIVKVTVKLTYAQYVLLKRFKGATDGEKIARLVSLANQSLTEATERAQKAVVEKQEEYSSPLAKVKRAVTSAFTKD